MMSLRIRNVVRNENVNAQAHDSAMNLTGLYPRHILPEVMSFAQSLLCRQKMCSEDVVIFF